LQRLGHTNTNATLFGMMDNLSYTYDSGNKLTKVDDTSGKGEGFKDVSGSDYTYDANGNMISDNNKGISSISYNHLNLPIQVLFPSQMASISYVYNATGVKFQVLLSLLQPQSMPEIMCMKKEFYNSLTIQKDT
jgi:hypothetical protein